MSNDCLGLVFCGVRDHARAPAEISTSSVECFTTFNTKLELVLTTPSVRLSQPVRNFSSAVTFATTIRTE